MSTVSLPRLLPATMSLTIEALYRAHAADVTDASVVRLIAIATAQTPRLTLGRREAALAALAALICGTCSGT